MARFSIYSADGTAVRFTGTPVYNGSYMKAAYLEFREISSPTPITWQVGDYVDYTRTGLRYKLYNIPQPTKKAASGSYGGAFVYSNVQLYADTKKLEIALFRDLVPLDNQIHFSTQQAISVYDNVSGIAERLQACMDDYDPNKWIFRVISHGADFGTADYAAADYATASYEALVNEDREFTMSGGSVLDALKQIYDTWDEEVGWVHTVANGKNIITIGKATSAMDDMQTALFCYGKGLGLRSLKKSQANKDSMATRLYVYGSSTNMYPGYYRGKEILDADSVDIQNLMIPIANWGTTYDEEEEEYLPDAKKAYIENTTATTAYGLIPKSAYFDGTDNEEIYPSIKGITIKDVRDAKTALGETDYVPSATVYTNPAERVDVIKSVTNPTDDGTETSAGGSYTDVLTDDYSGNIFSCSFATGELERFKEADSGYLAGVTTGGYDSVMTIAAGSVNGTLVMDDDMICSVQLIVNVDGEDVCTKNLLQGKSESGTYTFSNDEITIKGVGEGVDVDLKVKLVARNYTPSAQHGATVTLTAGTAVFSFKHNLPPSFSLVIKQIGFNIATRADLGDGKTIHFLDGNCAGRSFKIKRVGYQASTDDWFLWMYRGYDEDLSLYFPNSVYPIAAGDHFVILDIAMPELYIQMASDKLLTKGRELLAETSRIEPYYEPEIDAIQMAKDREAHPNDEQYILREGKFFVMRDKDIVPDGEMVLIDSLTITEGEAQIPTYKVSLREKKAVTFQQSTANTIKTLEQKVIDTSGTMKSVNFDSTDYNDLENIPTIDGTEVKGGMKSYADLGLVNKTMMQLVTDSSTTPATQYLELLYNLVALQITASGNITGAKFIKTNGTSAQILRANGDATILQSSEVETALGQQFINVVNAINALTSSGLMRFTYNSSTPVSVQRLRQVQFNVDGVSAGTYDPESTVGSTQQIDITTGGSTSLALDDLTDVNIQSPARGQILAYNYTEQEWYNADPSLSLSDRNLKNIKSQVGTADALEKIQSIETYVYAYKDRPDDERIGFIAQEWETQYPQVVKDVDGVKMMDYNATTAILLAAVKSLTAKVTALETRLAALEGE